MVDEAVVEVEQEQLRSEMDESRMALVQKIEQLENKVSETVQSATASVADATASVMETVQNATNSVSETVDSVTSAVQGTVDTVRQSVEGTVDSVKETFDLTRQVERHPWLMLSGAVALGYFGERFLRSNESVPTSLPRPDLSRSSSRGRMEEGASSSLDESLYQPFLNEPAPQAVPPTQNPPSAKKASAAPPTVGLAETMVQMFAPEISRLQSLVFGMAMSAVRDAIVPSIPVSFQQPVDEILCGFTQKLGGHLPASAGVAKSAEVEGAINTLNDT
ncbi:hypothetical protein [Schlesneria paludicola]|uniref:hypothetical protein n=1 Tax=Schlesneria paludicola TaxID=360056 RepID=UPI00029A7F16|nr:hypothetical protein [Schlesneria paludicola]